MAVARSTVAAFLLALGLAYGLPAAAQDLDCAECHEDVKLPEFSVHAETGCADCHSEISDVPHENVEKGPPLCAQCHDAGPAVAASPHADVGCLPCHGANAHEIRPIEDPLAAVTAVKQIQTCGECHGGGEKDLVAGYVSSVHGRGLLISGLVVAPSCADCHGAHQILPPANEASRVSWKNTPTTCGECHKGVLDTWRDMSAHGAEWQKGNHEAPVCTTCHTSHDVTEPWERGARLHSPEGCGDCHGGRFHTYRDSFHGKSSELGFVAAAVCSDCHTPHANLPTWDPRSSVHPDNLMKTCGSCHPGITPSFLTFEPHDDPTSSAGNKSVHYIWLFMTLLLVTVFGGFGLHALLWLQRSIVGVMRGEFKHSEHEALHEKWVRRFPKIHRYTHLTIILTFLVLAATGLPLKFHFTGWAQALMGSPGTVEITRFLHRFAAVFTFGYAIVHLAFILVRAWRREGGLFWGWTSMVPQPRDIRDVFANIRYFLYLGPRPRFDRFTYWEKFDYFAVFWGIPVIGLSGLMLWFPAFFTQFLPGWVLNAAFVVHSDEALLATSFIFVFHFFHTHLRPESFPLDPVIFTGSMPMSKFIEERPEEYERMLASGTLEAHLEDPPTPERLRNIFAFGFFAVTIGLILAIGIFVGMLSY